MSKPVLLNPKVAIRYGGVKHSLGQRFYAEADDAERFVSTGQADRVTPADDKAAAALTDADAAADLAGTPRPGPGPKKT